MRLIQYSEAADELRLGAVEDGIVIDLARAGVMSATMEELLAEGLDAARAAVDHAHGMNGEAGAAGLTRKLEDVTVLAPLLRPAKIICVGINYFDHAAEAETEPPKEPIIFSKYASSIVGPTDVVELPAVSRRVDWEAELAAVIGRRGKNIPADQAADYIAGYTVANDVSAREWQLAKPMKQWLLGKSFDTFLPLGPAIVTADEVADPYALRISCAVNGVTKQDASTSELLFRVPELISYVSQVFTLEPGDLILTGTPDGVGGSRNPPEFLQDGDVLTTTVEGLGSLENPVRGAAAR
jgi:2-keto-4-pentenoate hydratase/2-oxohepta-3-ene-1,7-dioic acid hydratase in catechol pathway